MKRSIHIHSYTSSTYKKGFSLVEVLVAVSIISLSVFAIMSSAQKSVKLSSQSLNKAQASYLLEEGAEAVKIVRDNNWSTISGLTIGTTYYPTFTGGTWTLSTTPTTVGIFTRTVVLATVYRDNFDDIASSGTTDAGTKKVTVTVTWPNSDGTATDTVSFYISDIFN
jgi:prepilin-type N-terminal cleavage/methylation domain-containing protein